jgi:hypothetical protein
MRHFFILSSVHMVTYGFVISLRSYQVMYLHPHLVSDGSIRRTVRWFQTVTVTLAVLATVFHPETFP